LRNSSTMKRKLPRKNANIPFAFGYPLEHLPRPLSRSRGSDFTYGDTD
jgi:hypothetical protein